LLPPSAEVRAYEARVTRRELQATLADARRSIADLQEALQQLSAVHVERGRRASETTRDARFAIKAAAHATAPEDGR
jgi:hypothetical protein